MNPCTTMWWNPTTWFSPGHCFHTTGSATKPHTCRNGNLLSSAQLSVRIYTCCVCGDTVEHELEGW